MSLSQREEKRKQARPRLNDPSANNHPMVHCTLFTSPFAHIPYLLATAPLATTAQLRHPLRTIASCCKSHSLSSPFAHIFGTSTKSLPLICYSLGRRLSNPACPVSTAIPIQPTRLCLARRYTGVTSEKPEDYSNCNSHLRSLITPSHTRLIFQNVTCRTWY